VLLLQHSHVWLQLLLQRGGVTCGYVCNEHRGIAHQDRHTHTRILGESIHRKKGTHKWIAMHCLLVRAAKGSVTACSVEFAQGHWPRSACEPWEGGKTGAGAGGGGSCTGARQPFANRSGIAVQQGCCPVVGTACVSVVLCCAVLWVLLQNNRQLAVHTVHLSSFVVLCAELMVLCC
jgi:hypothetical protein